MKRFKNNDENPVFPEEKGKFQKIAQPQLDTIDIDNVLESIISNLGRKNPHDLLQYRSVSHKWNDEIVRQLTKAGHSFQIPLRYGPQVPHFIFKTEAQRLTTEILDDVINTLSGNYGSTKPVAHLPFDTVVVDRDFYLAGAIPQWTRFLENHGNSIRHLKFNIREGRMPKSFENHAASCSEVVSRESVRTAFSFTSNLESLDFCVRFSQYPHFPCDNPVVIESIFTPDSPPPQLNKLTKMNIQESFSEFFSVESLKEIISMAPNLTSLHFHAFRFLSTFAAALNSLEPKNITALGITNAFLQTTSPIRGDVLEFSYLRLTTLELDNIYGPEKHYWISTLLQAQHSTLVKLILGNKDKAEPRLFIENNEDSFSLDFPPVMDKLKMMEINLAKFKLAMKFWSYQKTLPELESLTLTGYDEGDEGYLYRNFMILVSLASFRADNKCLSLKQFSVILQKKNYETEKQNILSLVKGAFPFAEYHFHN